MNYDRIKMCVMCGKKRACCGFGPVYCLDCAKARPSTGDGDCLNLFKGNGHSSGAPQGNWDNVVRALEESR